MGFLIFYLSYFFKKQFGLPYGYGAGILAVLLSLNIFFLLCLLGYGELVRYLYETRYALLFALGIYVILIIYYIGLKRYHKLEEKYNDAPKANLIITIFYFFGTFFLFVIGLTIS